MNDKKKRKHRFQSKVNRLDLLIDYLESSLKPLKEEREKLVQCIDGYDDSQIAELHMANWTQIEIAQLVGVTQPTIQRKVKEITVIHTHFNQTTLPTRHTHKSNVHVDRK